MADLSGQPLTNHSLRLVHNARWFCQQGKTYGRSLGHGLSGRLDNERCAILIGIAA
jgi:hypothetical protein